MKIVFNTDSDVQIGGKITKEERIEYFSLVNQLTSRNPELDYETITGRLMEYLRREAFQKVDELGYEQSKKDKMKSDLEYIFSTTDHSDTNYIGRINIVSFQIIILFTENCHPPDSVFSVNLNNEYDNYTNLREGDWKNYIVMRARYNYFKIQ